MIGVVTVPLLTHRLKLLLLQKTDDIICLKERG